MSTTKTTPRKSSTRAKTTARKATTKPAVGTAAKAPAKPAPAPAKVAAEGTVGPVALRKKELIDRVVKRSGLKKRDAKPVAEAMLAEMGEALAEGRSLILPPLGRVRINRTKTMPNGRVMVVKVRQTEAPLKAFDDPAGDEGKN